MDHTAIIESLGVNAGVIESLVKSCAPQQAVWRPAEGRWSILEVICHLGDEEWEDFRPRVLGSIRDPGFMPERLGDPEERARERKYVEQDVDGVLGVFVKERKASVEELRALDSPDWKAGFTIPGVPKLTAENVLAAWLAHDYLHTTQLIRLLRDYLEGDAKPYTLDYAGSL